MIELKPNPYNYFKCPECKNTHIHFRCVLIEGVHVVGEYSCENCGLDFYQLFPVGHSVGSPVAYGKYNGKLYDDENGWVSVGLADYFKSMKSDVVEFKKKVFKKYKKVIILNALDFLYGHCLLKLLNVQHHLDEERELGVVVIIPKIFEWLVPEGCAEVWIADIKLSELLYRHSSINNSVTTELSRFDEVYFSEAFSHPDFSKIDIERFTGVRPFNISRFNAVPKRVCFILREDRWWLKNILNFRVFQLLRKLGLQGWAQRYMVHQQSQLIKRTITLIRKQIPFPIEFSIAGVGNAGTFNGFASDYRSNKVTKEVEIAWCEIYAASHLVIGVHGSNMILPTAFAAGCIEILPEDRYANIVQDLSVKYPDRRQLFLYRFVNQFARPKQIAAHVISVFKDYELFNKNMCVNQFKEEHVINDKD
jgi:hypothetical protein